ncbi:hypothetical protein FQZ97_944980 [compost metagenome]
MNAEPYLFMKMCLQIILLGMSSHRAHRAFQRWLVRAGATGRLEKFAAIQRWYRAKYRPYPQMHARRLEVVRELLAVRRQLKPSRTAVSPDQYDLPELQRWVSASRGLPAESVRK